MKSENCDTQLAEIERRPGLSWLHRRGIELEDKEGGKGEDFGSWGDNGNMRERGKLIYFF